MEGAVMNLRLLSPAVRDCILAFVSSLRRAVFVCFVSCVAELCVCVCVFKSFVGEWDVCVLGWVGGGLRLWVGRPLCVTMAPVWVFVCGWRYLCCSGWAMLLCPFVSKIFYGRVCVCVCVCVHVWVGLGRLVVNFPNRDFSAYLCVA